MEERKELTIEEIHEGTIGILKKIIELCDMLQVNYYIMYGSLIGAVRHHGFIPWDDDLDIAMLRPEYEKLCSYCETHQAELGHFALMNRRTAKDYPYNISRFCDMRYSMEKKDTIPGAGMGMFIDIYPFDGAGPDAQEAVKKYSRKKYFYQSGLVWAFSKDPWPAKRSKLLAIPKLPFWLYAKARGAQYFLDKLDALQHSYRLEDSTYVACMVWDPQVYPMKKSFFEGYELLEFEGLQVKAPHNYDELLRLMYGDYMQLPPVEARVPTHEYRLYRK